MDWEVSNHQILESWRYQQILTMKIMKKHMSESRCCKTCRLTARTVKLPGSISSDAHTIQARTNVELCLLVVTFSLSLIQRLFSSITINCV